MENTRLLGIVCSILYTFFTIPVHAAPVSGQGTWETTLEGRDLDGDAATIEAFYDTVLDITWLADAGAGCDGTRASALAWVDSLSYTVGDNTWDAWRLPHSRRVDGRYDFINPDFNLSFDGSTDIGYNISAPGTVYVGSMGSELAHLFYNTLGNKAIYDTSGNYPQPGWGLSNSGPFMNIDAFVDLQAGIIHAYWTRWIANPGDNPFVFSFGIGSQDHLVGVTGVPWLTSNEIWVVHDGDDRRSSRLLNHQGILWTATWTIMC